MPDLDMRQHIRESNLIEGIEDPAEVDQSLKAWTYLIGQDQLTHEVVCKTQRLICANQTDLRDDQKGHYRSVSRVNVRVGSYVAPRWHEVDDLMAEWLDEHDRLSPWLNHVAFESVHPFVDGNGRTGRALYWWDQARAGEKPRLLKASERHKYYRELERARLATSVAAWMDEHDA
jgi:Fic family protein